MTRATTGTGAQIFIAAPSAPNVLLPIEEVSDVQPIRSFDVVDVTNFNSDLDKEFIKGLRNPGRYTVRGNWITTVPGQVMLRQAFECKRPYWFMIVLPPNPGDAVGEIWFFKALVLSSDPIRIAPGKKLEFESLLQATGRRTPGPVYLNATGTIRVFQSGTLGNGDYACRFENFTVRTVLPLDADIQGIYPVIVASVSNQVGDTYFQYGPSLSMTGPGGTGFSFPSVPANSNFSSTEFYDVSIGTDLSDLTGQEIRVLEEISLLLFDLGEEIDITAVAFAVVYNSIEPVIDPLIPPPFALGSGQGLAWALPATSTQSGSFLPRGYSLASPAVLDLTQNA